MFTMKLHIFKVQISFLIKVFKQNKEYKAKCSLIFFFLILKRIKNAFIF